MSKVEVDPREGIWALPSFPVVLVTVMRNVMTAAAFHFYSFEPPMVMVGIRPQSLTFHQISEYKEFGINLPLKEQLEIVQMCGSISGRDEDKFQKTGLTPMKGREINSVLVKECPVSLECRVVHKVQFEGSHRWFVGEVLAAHVEEGYSRDQVLMYWLREYRSVGEILHRVKRR
ncbi:MAG: flavin reductase family protein [Candidatus Hermodarchaeota archaeon]